MYESHYGISQKPFQLSPDPRFFFASSRHQQALSYLEYGLQQAEGFIVVTGPIGTGKTTLAQSLLASIDDSDIEAVNIVTPNLSPLDLLQQIVNEFNLGVVDSSKSNLLVLIEQHLIRLTSQDRRALLLVDEAQNLPLETLEELRMLSNIQKKGKPLLQSFLLGQEELKDLLQMPQMEQFRQRIIASCHLKPLNINEMKSYIEHRLATVGFKEQTLFANSCYPLMMDATGGIPRKINLLADRVMLFGYLENTLYFEAEHIEAVLTEMKQELSASIGRADDNKQAPVKAPVQAIKHSTETMTLQQLGEQYQQLGVDDDLRNTLMRVDRYLQKNIDEKLKMNRYLDKLLRQKQSEVNQKISNGN
ncbi:DUF2075 domain-containing protein [Thalassotalea sp. HSM 43]|uniref:ExeA family protein n=1 Tax=Thalassotalea sp. HSM 43 TaxID=2552945 RepID=UPI0010804696|nr:AAA family ATPase [Thalassotalea sp. HSM 43]QBY04189.1 DUF2075 domain-containing protein [Thalassotalea sp. HSM 43]